MTEKQTIELALNAIQRIYQAGYDSIVSAGGSCDQPRVMFESDPAVRELRAILDQPAQEVKQQVEQIPITEDMGRLMEAYRLGEFSDEGGSETVEALSVASFDAVESQGHDVDSYMAGYCAAIYEQVNPFIGMALKPKQQGEAVAYLHRNTRHAIPALRNKWEPITVASAIAHMQNKALAEEGREDEFHLGHEFQKCYTEQPAPVAKSTTSDKYKAELYDEVWQKARDMGFANVTDALEKLSSPVAVVLPEQTVRRAFICKGCEGVYADEAVSKCDCMCEPDFVEGEISYAEIKP